MGHDFIEKNRDFLRGLSKLVRIVSIVLIVLGSAWAGLKSVALVTRLGDWSAFKEEWANTPSGIFVFLLLGIVGLGMSQLLRYMLDPEYRPGRILRHGDKLLYLYAGYIILEATSDIAAILSRHGPWGWAVLAISLDALFALAAGVILVGLAQILKRLLPIVDEARTLA